MRRFADMTASPSWRSRLPRVIVAVVGIAARPRPRLSDSATRFFADRCEVGVASDSHDARQTVTENGVRFSFRAPRSAGWESFSNSISTGKSLEGRSRSTSPSWGHKAQRRSSTGRASRTATTPIRVPVCCARRLADRPPISQPQCRRRPAPSSSRALRTSPWADAPRSTWCSPFARTSAATLGSSSPGDRGGGAFWRTTDVGDTIRVWIVAVSGTRLFIAAATTGRRGLKKEIQQIVESIRFA